ncbi:MAG: aldo/keto reductase [Thermoproteota archaeon]
MEYRTFGKSNFKVSAIGMGTYYDPLSIIAAKFGFHKNKDFKISALKKGIELGINLIDTAEIYGTEVLVAEAVSDFKRDELFIATKVWPNHLHYHDVLKAAARSIKKLSCSYIDLYQIHWPNPKVPIEETMRAMSKLVDEGKVRYIGVSNFSLEQMITAQGALTKYELISNQVEYNLLNRRIEKTLLPYCERENIAIMAYRPLSHGLLSNPKGDLKMVIERIGQRNGGRTPAQVALNWILKKSKLTFPIPRASRPQRVLENLGSVGWYLSDIEMEELENMASTVSS